MGPFIVEFNLRTRSPLTVESGDAIVDTGYSTVTVRSVPAESHDAAINKIIGNLGGNEKWTLR